MPRPLVPAPTGQQDEPLRQALVHLCGRQGHRPRCHQLDGEGNAFQGPAQRGHGGGVAGRELEVRPGGLGAVHEELRAGRAGDKGDRRVRVRLGQGRHEELALAGQGESAARGDQAGQAGQAGQQGKDQGGTALDEVFEVVQHEQGGRAGGQSGHDLLQRGGRRRARQGQCPQHGVAEQGCLGQIGQRDEADRAKKTIRRAGRMGGQPRLARPARPGERHQPRLGGPQPGGHLGRFVFAPEEPGELKWEAAQFGGHACRLHGPGLRGPGGGGLARRQSPQPLARLLVERIQPLPFRQYPFVVGAWQQLPAVQRDRPLQRLPRLPCRGGATGVPERGLELGDIGAEGIRVKADGVPVGDQDAAGRHVGRL